MFILSQRKAGSFQGRHSHHEHPGRIFDVQRPVAVLHKTAERVSGLKFLPS